MVGYSASTAPAADVGRSTSGPTPPAEPCPPTAPHRRSHAGPAPVCAAPRSPRRQDRVKRGGELGIPITNQVPHPAEIVPELHEEVPGLLDHPLPTGCAVTASTWTRRVAYRSKNGTYSCRNKTVSTVKKSTAGHALGLGPQELPPGPAPTAGRWFDARGEGGPDGAGPDLVAEAAQLAVDAAISPGRVLSCQPLHQPRSSAAADGPPMRIRPAASDQVPMLRAGCRLDDQHLPGRARQEPRQPGQHRPVGPVNAWPGHLAAQHRDLVAQHEQLGILDRRTVRQQCEPPQHLAEQQIEQSQVMPSIIVAR